MFKANDPDDGINAKIKYSLTELSQTKLYNENESSSTCKTLSFKSLKHQNTSCNLLQYLYLNQSSGSLTLIKQLPLNLLNTTCRLRVEASDMGIIPLQTTRFFCLHIMTTNDLKQVKWMSYTKQYRHSIMYVYIIVAVISIGLIISLIFVCIAFTIWKYPKLEMNRTVIKESTSYNDSHQISRILCVTEKSNTSTNEEIYHTVVCTENEWANINPQSAEANQSQYLNKDNYYHYFAESQYPRNRQIFESFQQNKNPSSEQLFNELNVCVNANYPLSYSSLPQQGKILFYDSV
ncbi:unnamed protein product [Trichobilharzia szidati]|nr:unnamed protein product [Trichobilharzia szidati]